MNIESVLFKKASDVFFQHGLYGSPTVMPAHCSTSCPFKAAKVIPCLISAQLLAFYVAMTHCFSKHPTRFIQESYYFISSPPPAPPPPPHPLFLSHRSCCEHLAVCSNFLSQSTLGWQILTSVINLTVGIALLARR